MSPLASHLLLWSIIAAVALAVWLFDRAQVRKQQHWWNERSIECDHGTPRYLVCVDCRREDDEGEPFEGWDGAA
jgi:hypothetical protein